MVIQLWHIISQLQCLVKNQKRRNSFVDLFGMIAYNQINTDRIREKIIQAQDRILKKIRIKTKSLQRPMHSKGKNALLVFHNHIIISWTCLNIKLEYPKGSMG